jgi:hypothetical protein
VIFPDLPEINATFSGYELPKKVLTMSLLPEVKIQVESPIIPHLKEGVFPATGNNLALVACLGAPGGKSVVFRQ